MAIPGLKVVAPSTPADVDGPDGGRRSATRTRSIFCEHKALLRRPRARSPTASTSTRSGTAEVVRRRHGRDDRRAGRDGAQGASRPPTSWPPSTASTSRSSTCARSSRSTPRRSSRRSPRRAGCSPSRRTRGCAAGARRSPRSSPTRASTASMRRSSGSPRRTSRCRPRPPSRISRCRPSSGSWRPSSAGWTMPRDASSAWLSRPSPSWARAGWARRWPSGWRAGA